MVLFLAFIYSSQSFILSSAWVFSVFYLYCIMIQRFYIFIQKQFSFCFPSSAFSPSFHSSFPLFLLPFLHYLLLASLIFPPHTLSLFLLLPSAAYILEQSKLELLHSAKVFITVTFKQAEDAAFDD